MPIAGGTPTRIADGMPFEMQPQFSPDGTRIAFTSDRGGGDNIWIMNADGSDKRQLTSEKFRLLNEPVWTKDGRYIAARKHFTTQRSLGTGEIWLYHVGGGDGVLLVKRSNEALQKELGEPAFTPDGTGVYYTATSRPETPSSTRRIPTPACSRSSATTLPTARSTPSPPAPAVRCARHPRRTARSSPSSAASAASRSFM